jgi:hypothetical protein
MPGHIPAGASTVPGAVTHGTSASASWIDIVLADDEWVRREFDELIAHGWGGSGALPRPTHRGAHEPRRSTPRFRRTHQRPPVSAASAGAPHRSPARAPPITTVTISVQSSEEVKQLTV